jgi:subtilase family serine protease
LPPAPAGNWFAVLRRLGCTEQTYLGFTTVTTGATGNAGFSAAGLAALPAGENYVTLSGNVIANTATLSSPTGTVAYNPAQIRTAYGISSLTLDGPCQTIAIVVAYDDPGIYQTSWPAWPPPPPSPASRWSP